MSPGDWQPRLEASPLAWPVRAALQRLGRASASLPCVSELDAALGPAAGVRFLEASPRPRGRRARRGVVDPSSLYDARIALEGIVPTRAGCLHDLSNALTWATFPAAKRRLHGRQHAVVSRGMGPACRALPKERSREGDALAMLDEGGVVVLVKDEARSEVCAALAVRDSEPLKRARAERLARGVVFGHALLEHLAMGRSATILGFAIVFGISEGAVASIHLEDVDAMLAARIADPSAFVDPRAHGGVPLELEVLGGEDG